MNYYNPVLHEVLMNERKREFELEADRRRLIRMADGQQPDLKKNIWAAIRNLIKRSPGAQGSSKDQSFRPELSR